jgi:hypothetical protein
VGLGVGVGAGVTVGPGSKPEQAVRAAERRRERARRSVIDRRPTTRQSTAVKDRRLETEFIRIELIRSIR